MSWSVGFSHPVLKSKAEEEIDKLKLLVDDEFMNDQLSAAKRAAKELLKSVPGPGVAVSLSGHGNGVGFNKKEGWANDYILVNVSQVTDFL